MLSLRELETDPHNALALIRPIGWVEALNAWVVTSRHVAMVVLRDPETFTVDDPRFSTSQVFGPSMLSHDGARHSTLREPFEAGFGLAETQRRFAEPVEKMVGQLMAEIRPAGAADLRTSLAGPLSVGVVALALGLPVGSAATVLNWYTAITASVSEVEAGRGATAEGSAAVAALHKHVAAGLESADSLLSAAAQAGLSLDDVVTNAALFMFGGIETTEGMITNALWHLLTHPDQLDLVLTDPSLLPNALEESLRLEPAATLVDRYATCDVDLAGVSIQKGDLVTVSLAGAGRDPELFDRPDDFDVRRDNARRHLAFASGAHICIGLHLARLETLIALRAILRLPNLRLTAGSPPPRGLIFRKPAAVNVTWQV